MIIISALFVDAIALIGLVSSNAMDPGLSSSMIVTTVFVSPPCKGTAFSIGDKLSFLS